MRRIQFKTLLLFLFRLLLLTRIYYHLQFSFVAAIENTSRSNINNVLANTGENGVNLNERMKKIEGRSRRQEQEITQLTTNAAKDRKVINQLNDRVAQLEESSTVAGSLVRSKRLYRLLPITHDEKGDKNNKQEQINLSFYGPATNCEELGKLGFTLNGHYLVKSKDQELESSRGNIDVVYCLFQQPLKGSIQKGSIKEERFGSIVLTSTLNKLPTQNDGNKMAATSKTISQSQAITSSHPSLAKYDGSTTKSWWATSKPTYSQSMGPVFESSKLVSVNEKEGKSFLLKNKRNKCMSSGRLNPHGPYEDNCDSNNQFQYWKWCDDNKICNYMDQFLSKEYIGVYTEPNRKTEKVFHVKLSSLSKYLDQKWRATALGQLVDTKDGVCIGVAYNSIDRQHLLIKVLSCDEKDDGQFWSFESTTFSTLEAQFKKLEFSDKPTSPVTKSAKLIPLSQKDGKSYHLMNKHSKCVSSKNKNKLEVRVVQSNCNATETRQLWKWSGDSLCSDFGCLSKVQKYAQDFQVLLGEENYDSPWVNQNWSATNEGQLLSSTGLCLASQNNSDLDHVFLVMETCDKKRKGQLWSFAIVRLSDF